MVAAELWLKAILGGAVFKKLTTLDKSVVDMVVKSILVGLCVLLFGEAIILGVLAPDKKACAVFDHLSYFLPCLAGVIAGVTLYFKNAVWERRSYLCSVVLLIAAAIAYSLVHSTPQFGQLVTIGILAISIIGLCSLAWLTHKPQRKVLISIVFVVAASASLIVLTYFFATTFTGLPLCHQ